MNVWGCCRRRASVANARMELFAELIVRIMRRQQRGEPISTTVRDKSPKIDWSSLLSAVNLVDESGRARTRSSPRHVVNDPFVHCSCSTLLCSSLPSPHYKCRDLTRWSSLFCTQYLSSILRASLRLLTSLSPTLYGFISSEPRLDAYLELQTYSADHFPVHQTSPVRFECTTIFISAYGNCDFKQY